MTEMMTTDVRAIMDRTPFDVSAVADLREVLNRDPSRYRTLRDAVATIRDREAENKDATPETHLRLGVGEILLGRYNAGLDSLKRAGDAGMAYYFQGLALENLLRYAEAAEAFEKSGKAGYDARNSELHLAGALRRIGKIDDAKKILHGLETHGGSSAEYHFQQGAMLASEGELELASVELEKALSLDKDHNGALFELAYINDLFGNDETAVDFYKRCTDARRSRWPPGSTSASFTRTRCGSARPNSATAKCSTTCRTTPAPGCSCATARPARGCTTTRKPRRDTPSSSSFWKSPSPTSNSRSAAATASAR